MGTTRRVVVVGYHTAELLDIASVTTTLTMANVAVRRQLYEVTLATPGGRPITCGTGLTVACQAHLEKLSGPLADLHP